MRLIDADKLIETNLSVCDKCLNQSEPTIFCNRCPMRDFIKTINDAPTVKPTFGVFKAICCEDCKENNND